MQTQILFVKRFDYLSVLEVIGDSWEGLEAFPDSMSESLIKTAKESADLEVFVTEVLTNGAKRLT